jgi:hypothetical protein
MGDCAEGHLHVGDFKTMKGCAEGHKRAGGPRV